MRIRHLGTLVVSVSALVALPLPSQIPARRATRSQVNPPAVTPYTAEFRITRIRTLENGTTITHESTEVRAVESHGRTMTATTTRQPSGEESTFSNLYDPATGKHSSWTVPGNRVTELLARAQVSAASPCAPAVQAQPAAHQVKRTSTTEDLGTEEIESIEARGRRTTTTTPAGEVGNSEPLVSTHEVWIAVSGPKNIVLREIDDDPESGKMTKELTSISLNEPDESLFAPPQGYEVVDRQPGPPACAAGPKVAAGGDTAQ